MWKKSTFEQSIVLRKKPMDFYIFKHWYNVYDNKTFFNLINIWNNTNTWNNKNLEVGLSNDITEIEAWDKNFNQHKVILTNKKINKPISKQWFVSPNPTSGEVVVNMNVEVNKNITLELINETGKTVYSQGFDAIKGTNIYKLNLR